MTPDQVTAFFDAHYTVRKYKNVSMPAEHLDVILHAAQRAPTDATAQMYSFIRLTDPEIRQSVATLSGNAHIATASEVFIICADIHRLEQIVVYSGREFGHNPLTSIHFSIGDAVMAAQNMLMASEMLGYKGCWIGGVMNEIEAIAQKLNLPNHVLPFAGMTIGIPDEPVQHRPRLDRALIVHENTYRIPGREELAKSVENMAVITKRGDWAQTLGGYFAKGGSMERREKILREFLEKRFGY